VGALGRGIPRGGFLSQRLDVTIFGFVLERSPDVAFDHGAFGTLIVAGRTKQQPLQDDP
jgi:hypothetical protein